MAPRKSKPSRWSWFTVVRDAVCSILMDVVEKKQSIENITMLLVYFVVKFSKKKTKQTKHQTPGYNYTKLAVIHQSVHQGQRATRICGKVTMK